MRLKISRFLQEINMEQFLRQLNTLPEVAELVRRVEDGGCPAAIRQVMQQTRQKRH